MAETYQLKTISDLLKIPVDRIDAFLGELRLAMEAAHFVGGENVSDINFDDLVWTDDGERRVNMGLEIREEVDPTAAPVSDHAAALRKIAEGNLGDGPGQANYARIRAVAADALSPYLGEILTPDEKETALAQAVELAGYVEQQAKGAMRDAAARFLSLPYAKNVGARLASADILMPAAVRARRALAHGSEKNGNLTPEYEALDEAIRKTVAVTR